MVMALQLLPVPVGLVEDLMSTMPIQNSLWLVQFFIPQVQLLL